MRPQTRKLFVVALYFMLAAGWPLFIYYYSVYKGIKMESETYVEFYAKKRALEDYQAGRVMFYKRDGTTMLTTSYEGVVTIEYSQNTFFPDKFVLSYNRKMAELIKRTQSER